MMNQNQGLSTHTTLQKFCFKLLFKHKLTLTDISCRLFEEQAKPEDEQE